MKEKIKDFFFRNKTTRQTVAKNTFWQAVSNIGGRLLRAIVIIYAARVLGAAEWGVFAYATSLIAFVSFFVDFGVNTIITKEIAKKGEVSREAQIISTALMIKSAVLVPTMIALVFIIPHFMTDASIKMILPIAAFIFAFDTIREFGSSIFRAMEKMEWEAGMYLLTNLLIVVFGFIVLRLRPSVASFTYAYTFGTGVGMVATIYALRNKFKSVFKNFAPSIIGFILKSAWPIAISSFLGLLLTNTDVLIIAWLRSVEDVGLYSAALRVVQLMYILPAIIINSILPVLSRLARRDDGKFRMILERIISISFLIAIPAAAGGVLLGSQIISFLFGKSYLPATISFQLLIATIVVDFSATILTSAIFAYDAQKKLIIYSALGGILNVIFDLLFIPIMGIAGSGLATLLAQIISNAYLWRTMNKLNYFSILPHLKKIVAASIGMALVILALASIEIHVLAIIAVAIACYFAILVLLKEPLLLEMKSILQPGVSSAPLPGEVAAQ
jgi:PST family polysaccharide transporter